MTVPIPRLGKDAVTWAESHRQWPIGYCLMYVRSCLNLNELWPSAIKAWDNAGRRHHGDMTPPPGVPVFWKGGKFGHIALSAGEGFVWSTDVVTYGHVDRVPIGRITATWGYELLGWSADLNGVRVWWPPRFLSLSKLRAAAATDRHNASGLHPDQTNRVRKALGMRRETGRWSKFVTHRWKRMYPKTVGKPTAHSLAQFCETYDFTPRP